MILSELSIFMKMVLARGLQPCHIDMPFAASVNSTPCQEVLQIALAHRVQFVQAMHRHEDLEVCLLLKYVHVAAR